MLVHGSEAVHALVGQSPRMCQVFRLVEKLGRCRWSVLVLGETGTGKEVVARAIHDVMPVGPFVPIDCSSLVGPLMESELFGHVKGAFTGAVQTKTGLIEAAHGGTAFFDEIGELPLDLQTKLLRVLQEKEFRPVGSLTQRKSDFRVISATNRDLAKEVEQGTFRRDLYYRLNVVNLRMAPLRERSEDIRPLLDHFLCRYGNDHRLARDVEEALVGYDWPGNVRELENCVQHMIAMCSDRLLRAGDLPSAIQSYFAFNKSKRVAFPAPHPGGVIHWQLAGPNLDGVDELPDVVEAGEHSQFPARWPILPLTEQERRAIMQAIDYTNGDRVMAANLLQISRTTLYRRLREYAPAV